MLCWQLRAHRVRAQAYYRHNLRGGPASTRKDRGQRGHEIKVTYDELKDRFGLTPEQTKEEHSFPKAIYTWSWHGIRRYMVRLYVNPKDGQSGSKSEP